MNKKTLRSIFLGIAGCIVLYWLLHEPERIGALFFKLRMIFSPFIVGATMAFILNVPLRAFERLLSGIGRKGARRGLAILLTLLSVALVLAGVFWLLVPRLIQTVESLISQIPGFLLRTRDDIVHYLNNNPELMEWLQEHTDYENINWASVIQDVATWITGKMGNIVDSTITTVVSLGNGVFNAIVSLVFSLYCMGSKETLARQGRKLIYALFPEKFCDEAVRVLRMANSTFSSFLSGQCLEAVILGLMFAVCMSIFRMPYMPLVSVIIAVTALVPIVGAFVGCAVGAFFILVDNPVQAVGFVIMFLVLQQIEGNMIYPKVVGTSIGLPGMWVLVAVAVGGDLMGVGGMLLMIPLTSVLYALAGEYAGKRLAARKVNPDKLEAQPPELKSHFKEKRRKKREQRILKKMRRKETPEEPKE